MGWLRRIPGAVWGLIALAIGMGLGTLFPAQLAPVATAVQAGFKGLALAAPYIIFFTIGAALLDMMQGGKAGRFAFWVSIVFTAIGLFAGFLAILLVVPLFNLSWTGGGGSAGEGFGGLSGPQAVLYHLYDVAATSFTFFAVVWAAFASILLHFGTRWRGTRWLAAPTADMIRLVGVQGMALVGRGLRVAFPYLLFLIGIFIPAAITSAIAATERGLTGGPRIDTVVGANPVALYFLTVWLQVVVLAVFMAIVVLGVCWWTGFSIRAFFRDYFFYVYPFAWGTSSSAASIPVNLERTGEGLKVRKEVRDFIIPLGATVNLDGAIMACFVLTAMAAILVGYRPTFYDLLLLLIPIKIVTLGVPGIPGGIAAVVPPIVAEILPLPPGSHEAFLAIWFGFSVGLSDQFRTGVNTTTNGVVCMAFEKLYPRFFEKKGAAAGVSPEHEAPAP